MNKGANVHNNSFIDKWSRIRDKGRFKYLVTRGFGIGLLIFLIWFAVFTMTAEILLSPSLEILFYQKKERSFMQDAQCGSYIAKYLDLHLQI